MADNSTMPLHPRSGLFAIGLTPSGRPVWPVMGGDESEDAAAQAAAAAKANADKAAADKAAADKAAADAEAAKNAAERGFPENTPVAEMTPAQQAAYWKHQSRQHEGRVKALGGLTPDKLAELQAKAKRADDLDYELSSDKDKAVADAARDARESLLADVLPKLVEAEFKVVAAGRIEPATLKTILEPLDLSKFLDDSGEVDTAKVTAYVDGIAPAKGSQQQRRGPTPGGAGRRGEQVAGTSVQSGRELYRERHRRAAAAKS